MDPSKFVTSWCVRNIWGSYSIIIILLGMIASLSAFPTTGSVITQTSVPDEDQSLSDRSSRPMLVTRYVVGLHKDLESLCVKYVEERFDAFEPTPSENILENLPNVSELLPNKFSSEDLPRRMLTHYRILRLFNRSMDKIKLDENLSNRSYNFETTFSDLQTKIKKVLAGINDTIPNRSWEDIESVAITDNLEDIFTNKTIEYTRNLRAYTVLGFFNDYLRALRADLLRL